MKKWSIGSPHTKSSRHAPNKPLLLCRQLRRSNLLQIPPSAGMNLGGMLSDMLGGGTGSGGRRREGVVEALAKSAARSVGSQVGRAIIRGVFGSILGGRR